MTHSRKDSSSLDWGWTDWHRWAEELISTHRDDQVADTLADLGSQNNDLRRGMAAEAIIINAQVFSMNPKVVGKGRTGIVRGQVRRMLRCALAQEPPRPLVRWGLSWVARTDETLKGLEEEWSR